MAKSETRAITMLSGLIVEFGEKQRMKKAHGQSPDGKVWVQIDFDNGETVVVNVDPVSKTGLAACGHGLSQKLGDAAAGADNTNDAFESVLEIANRVSNDEWFKASEAGTGTAKGSSELVEALVVVLSQSKDVVRGMLSKLSQGDKMALRKTPKVAAVIEDLKAKRSPSKSEKEKAEAGASLLEALGRGEVPTAAVPAVPA